jgi:hypothetical protein
MAQGLTPQEEAERVGRLEEAIAQLSQAQARTEQGLQQLTQSVQQLARQVEGLSETVGGDIEDIAYIVLYDVLKREFGWEVGGVGAYLAELERRGDRDRCFWPGPGSKPAWPLDLDCGGGQA